MDHPYLTSLREAAAEEEKDFQALGHVVAGVIRGDFPASEYPAQKIIAALPSRYAIEDLVAEALAQIAAYEAKQQQEAK